MIIGNGDIASVLPDRDDLIFFASGVSNSQGNRVAAYDRELSLLMQQPKHSHIVYFSTLALFYSDTPYTRHKMRMESAVKTFQTYCILRLGNITWGKNPKTLLNYLKQHPEAEIKDEYRYIIDQDEFLHWVNMIPKWNVEINVPGKMLKVRDIYEQYVNAH